MGMAGAFVAVADDATAAYWNPAGLPTGAFLSLLADYTARQTRHEASRPDSPGTDEMGTFVGLSTNAIGFSYYRLRINQIERSVPPEASADSARQDQWGEAILGSVITHNVGLTTAQMLYPGVSVGSTLRYVRGSYGVDTGTTGLTTDEWLRDARELEPKVQHRVDLDVGLKLGGARLQAAIVARNLLQPTLEAPDGSSVRMDRQVRAGVAFRPVGALLLAGDIDLSRSATASGFRRNLAVGGEYWFGLSLAIRAGARLNLEDSSSHPRPMGALGFSLALSEGVYVDAQLSRGRDAVEQGWSVAARVGF
jgi:hypothetical protein